MTWRADFYTGDEMRRKSNTHGATGIYSYWSLGTIAASRAILLYYSYCSFRSFQRYGFRIETRRERPIRRHRC